MKCLKCFAGGIDCEGVFQGAFQYFGARLEFQDAELNTHIHSENYRIDKYECANGHTWEVKSYRHCGAPKCEWDKEHVDVKTWTSKPSESDKRLADAAA